MDGNVVPATQRKKQFPWGWVIGVFLVGGVAYWGYHHFHKTGDAKEGEQGAAMPASVATVISKQVMPWSEFSGRIEAMGAVEIRPQVSGQITQVLFQDGVQVKRGQPLFTIDPRAYEAEVNRAKGAAMASRSAAVNAEQNFARIQKLVKTKAVSQSEFEASKSALAQAQGNAAGAEGAYQAAMVNLGYAHIVAPISGKISRAELTEGNLVQAGPNAPLLASIVRLAPIYASFELDEQTFLKTIQGVPEQKLKTVPVEVLLAGKDTPIAARIHSFDNQIAPGSGTIRVRAVIDNKDNTLVPGLFAKVRIATPQETNAILINPAAIGTDQNKKFVLVVGEDNKTQYREITLGQPVEALQIVTSGLKEGEKIVVTGLQRLRPNMPVALKEVDMRSLKDPNAAADAVPAAGGEAKPENAGDAPAGAK